MTQEFKLLKDFIDKESIGFETVIKVAMIMFDVRCCSALVDTFPDIWRDLFEETWGEK